MKRMLSALLALCLFLGLTPTALGVALTTETYTYEWSWNPETGVHTFNRDEFTAEDADFMAALDEVEEDAGVHAICLSLSGDATIVDPPKEDGGQSTIKIFENCTVTFALNSHTLTMRNMHLGASVGAVVTFQDGNILLTQPAGKDAVAVPLLSARRNGKLNLSAVTATRTDGGVVVSTIVPKGGPSGACLTIKNSTLWASAKDMGEGEGLNAMIVAADTTVSMEKSTLTGSSSQYPTASLTGGSLTLDGDSSITATGDQIAAAIVRNGDLYLNGGALTPGAGAYAYGGRTNGRLHLSGNAIASSVELREGDQIVDNGYTGSPVVLTCTGNQKAGDTLVTGCSDETAVRKFTSSPQNKVGLTYVEQDGGYAVVVADEPTTADEFIISQDERDRYTVIGTYQDGGTYVLIHEESSFQTTINALFAAVQGTGATIQLGGDLTIVGNTEELPENAYPSTGVGEGWITWDLQRHTLNLNNICTIAQIDGTLTVKNGTVAFTGGKISPNAALFGAQDNGKMILEDVTATRDDGGCLLAAYDADRKDGARVIAQGCTLSNGSQLSRPAGNFGSNAVYVGAHGTVKLADSSVESHAPWAVANATGGTLEMDASSAITATGDYAAVTAENGTVRLQGAALTGSPALRDWGGSTFSLSGNAKAATIELAGNSVVEAAGYTGGSVALTYAGDVPLGHPLVTGCDSEATAKKFTVGDVAANVTYEKQSDGSYAAVATATPLTAAVTDFTQGTVYSISTKAEMERLAALVNAGASGEGCFFVLTSDLALAGSAEQPWTPIGSVDTGGTGPEFNGRFDGGGHTVSGLLISTNSTNSQGLFGAVGAKGAVRSVNVTGTITAPQNVGGIAGYSAGAIENCENRVGLSGGRHTVGGIVGWQSGGLIRSCANRGKATVSENVDMVGGVVGSCEGEIADCLNTGEVSGGNQMGGIAGYIFARGSVARCYNIGNVTGGSGSNGVGGIASVAAGAVRSCVSLGLAVSGGSSAGRIVADGDFASVCSSNFARADLILTGRQVTEETAVQNGKDGQSITLSGDWQESAFAGWDFERVWDQGAGDGLPTLKAVKTGPITLPRPSTHGNSSGSGGGSSNTKPFVTAGKGGTAKADGKGNVTIIPDQGYRIASITVNGTAVEIPKDGVLTGLWNRDKVTVTFEKIPPEREPALTPDQFTDLDPNAWYYDAVTRVLARGLFRGTAEKTFSPNDPMSRAMIFTMFYRISGEETAVVGESPWYAYALAWAVEKGISDGSNPNGEITREQLVTILYRYAKTVPGHTPEGSGETASFSDCDSISNYAKEAMHWAVGLGILTGRGDGRLAPADSVTRAETAAILSRYLEQSGAQT